MCRDCGPGQSGTSRRSFAAFLAVGAGLTVLAACTPPPPSGPVGTAEGPTSAGASGSTSAAASASPSPVVTEPDPAAETTAAPAPAPYAALPVQFSFTDPASPWLVVNKHRPLQPADYVPADLVAPAVALATSGDSALLNSTTAAAAEAMFAAAANDGVYLTLASGYRSYSTQAVTYNNHVAARGQTDADTASARPGYSEHQTGWAFDIADGVGACSFQPCFAEQPAGIWAAANGYRFGFVVRYPLMFHPITGYYYEPWHLRYVGVEAATDMANKGIRTLEEYFGTGVAPGYP